LNIVTRNRSCRLHMQHGHWVLPLDLSSSADFLLNCHQATVSKTMSTGLQQLQCWKLQMQCTQQWMQTTVYLQVYWSYNDPVSQKWTGHRTLSHNFAKCWPIFKFISLLVRRSSKHIMKHSLKIPLHLKLIAFQTDTLWKVYVRKLPTIWKKCLV